jgi:cytochrome c553
MNKTLILMIALLFSAPGFAKGDASAGAEKAKTVCAACHGADGNTPMIPGSPRLAGQRYDYLVHSLKQYKSGIRKNPIMAGQAQALSQTDIENVSAYFSELPGSLHIILEGRTR